MSDKRIKTLIADTFLEVADALETGQYGKKPVIGFAPKAVSMEKTILREPWSWLRTRA